MCSFPQLPMTECMHHMSPCLYNLTCSVTFNFAKYLCNISKDTHGYWRQWVLAIWMHQCVLDALPTCRCQMSAPQCLGWLKDGSRRCNRHIWDASGYCHDHEDQAPQRNKSNSRDDPPSELFMAHSQLSAATEHAHRYEAECRQLRQQLSVAEERAAEAEQQLKMARVRTAELAQEVATTKQLATAECLQLRQQLSAAEQRAAEAEQQLTIAKICTAALEPEVTMTKALATAGFLQQLSASGQRAAEAEQQLEKARISIAEQEREVAVIKRQLATSLSDHAGCEVKLRAREAAAQAAQLQGEQGERELDRLRSQLEAAQQQLASAQEQVQRLLSNIRSEQRFLKPSIRGLLLCRGLCNWPLAVVSPVAEGGWGPAPNSCVNPQLTAA